MIVAGLLKYERLCLQAGLIDEEDEDISLATIRMNDMK